MTGIILFKYLTHKSIIFSKYLPDFYKKVLKRCHSSIEAPPAVWIAALFAARSRCSGRARCYAPADVTIYPNKEEASRWTSWMYRDALEFRYHSVSSYNLWSMTSSDTLPPFWPDDKRGERNNKYVVLRWFMETVLIDKISVVLITVCFWTAQPI